MAETPTSGGHAVTVLLSLIWPRAAHVVWADQLDLLITIILRYFL